MDFSTKAMTCRAIASTSVRSLVSLLTYTYSWADDFINIHTSGTCWFLFWSTLTTTSSTLGRNRPAPNGTGLSPCTDSITVNSYKMSTKLPICKIGVAISMSLSCPWLTSGSSSNGLAKCCSLSASKILPHIKRVVIARFWLHIQFLFTTQHSLIFQAASSALYLVL